ncbi:MAG: CdaR family protein [Bdellovibrionota bacterium]
MPSRNRNWIDWIVNTGRANLGTKIISIFIAVFMWAIVLGSRNVEVSKDMALELITPQDLVASNEVPDKVTFKLSGPKAFLRAVLDRHEDPIRVNLTGQKPGLVTYRLFSDNIRLPIGVKVLSINPAAILVKLEYVKRRDVPVKVELRGSLPDGFKLGHVSVHPEVVRIKGPESKIDSVTEISTAPIDLSNLRQTLDREVSMDLSRQGVQIDGALPRVQVEVEPISANFRIKNVDIRVLSSYKVRLEESTVSVLVRAMPKDLKQLDRNHIYAVVDLTGKSKGRYVDVPVKVTLPENVGLAKVIPDHVTVTLY